jgi:pimeloyl-ACP methyl ester carboxylesterase
MTANVSTVAETRFVAVEGGRIAFDDIGRHGPLILAMPAWATFGRSTRCCDRRCSRPATESSRWTSAVSARRRRLSDYSAPAVGRDALALPHHLDAGPAVILGNSFAAGSALWAAHEAPNRVSGVVLLGPSCATRRSRGLQSSRARAWNGFAGPWRVWFWTTYWDGPFPTRKPANHGAAKAALARNLREPGRMAALEAMIGLCKAETAAIVSHTRVSAVVVMAHAIRTSWMRQPGPLACRRAWRRDPDCQGGRAPSIPRRQNRRLRKRCPSSTVSTAKGRAITSALRAKPEIATALRKILRRAIARMKPTIRGRGALLSAVRPHLGL